LKQRVSFNMHLLMGESKMKKLFLFVAILAVAFGMSAQPASADFILSLGVPNAAMSPFPGPYASVNVHLNSATQAVITFTSLSAGGFDYLLGDGGMVGVNIAGPFVMPTAADFSESNSFAGFTPGPIQGSPGPGPEDGFGGFNLTASNFDGFSHTATTVQFTVNSLGSWADASNVLTDNGSGFKAAAHVYATTAPASPTNGAIATGFVANGGTPTIPEPTTMLLLGLGLAGAGVVRRRRKN
jgi:PEP-CTERM motif-containing protein